MGGPNCLFHVKSFLKLLFAIGNIAVWGGGVMPSGSRGVRLLLEHQSVFVVLEVFKFPIEKGVIIAFKQLR